MEEVCIFLYSVCGSEKFISTLKKSIYEGLIFVLTDTPFLFAFKTFACSKMKLAAGMELNDSVDNAYLLHYNLTRKTNVVITLRSVHSDFYRRTK